MYSAFAVASLQPFTPAVRSSRSLQPSLLAPPPHLLILLSPLFSYLLPSRLQVPPNCFLLVLDRPPLPLFDCLDKIPTVKVRHEEVGFHLFHGFAHFGHKPISFATNDTHHFHSAVLLHCLLQPVPLLLVYLLYVVFGLPHPVVPIKVRYLEGGLSDGRLEKNLVHAPYVQDDALPPSLLEDRFIPMTKPLGLGCSLVLRVDVEDVVVPLGRRTAPNVRCVETPILR